MTQVPACLRQLARLVALILALSAGRVVAQAGPDQPDVLPAEWQPADLGGAALQLFTPTSGAFFARVRTPTTGEVRLLRSDDGGVSWQRLGGPDLGAVSDVALGTDGRNLYAATGAGVWRLSLAVQPAAAPPVRPGEDLPPDDGD